MRRLASVLWCVLAVGVVVSACSEKGTEEVTYQNGEVPDEIFTDFVTEETDSGLVQWKLMAPKANRFAKRNLVVLESPVVEFYDKHGALKSTLKSETGEYDEKSRDMLAYGDVVVRTIEGDVLETDSLMWVNTRNKIVSNSAVRLTQQGNVVTGNGLECDPNLNSVDIKSNVKATIREQEG